MLGTDRVLGSSELTIFTPEVMPVMLEGINNQFSKPA